MKVWTTETNLKKLLVHNQTTENPRCFPHMVDLSNVALQRLRVDLIKSPPPPHPPGKQEDLTFIWKQSLIKRWSTGTFSSSWNLQLELQLVPRSSEGDDDLLSVQAWNNKITSLPRCSGLAVRNKHRQGSVLLEIDERRGAALSVASSSSEGNLGGAPSVAFGPKAAACSSTEELAVPSCRLLVLREIERVSWKRFKKKSYLCRTASTSHCSCLWSRNALPGSALFLLFERKNKKAPPDLQFMNGVSRVQRVQRWRGVMFCTKDEDEVEARSEVRGQRRGYLLGQTVWFGGGRPCTLEQRRNTADEPWFKTFESLTNN